MISHTAQLAVSAISNGYRHLQSQQSLTSGYQLDGEAEGSTVQTSLNYSSSPSELFWKHSNLELLLKAALPFHPRCYFQSSPATCFVLGKSVWQVLPLPGVPGSCALLPECIYCCLYLHWYCPPWHGKSVDNACFCHLQGLLSPAPLWPRAAQDSCHEPFRDSESTNYEAENI